MTAAVVYRACRKAGIALAVNGDKIRYQAPADVPVPLTTTVYSLFVCHA